MPSLAGRSPRGLEYTASETRTRPCNTSRACGTRKFKVSERALRHVEALIGRKRAGDRAVLLFCVQHTGIELATTADAIYPEYGEAVRRAVSEGVEVIAYGCLIDRDVVAVDRALPVELS